MAKISACFWFDVEDYITPESDDALASLLRIFIDRQTRGTWKLVGEKYRVLQERGRADIIDDLHQQDVGYHTDNHSQHPTISEYTTGLSWQAGLEAFDRRERPSLDELRREFGVVSCYGQPGGAWAPQAFAALARWGVPMYLDEGRHLGLGKQPFWFQNVLTAFNLQENCVRADVWAADKAGALRRAEAGINAAVERLKRTGGLISIYYHPCEFATTQFWDGVNFARGKNPPRQEWRGAPLLAPAERQARLTLFADLLDLTLRHPDIEVVDATQLAGRYAPPLPVAPVPTAELAGLAVRMDGSITYAASTGGLLSPAEMIGGLLTALARWAEAGTLPAAVEVTAPLGPTEERGSADGGSATVAAVADAARAALASMRSSGHIPASTSLGGRDANPAALFAAAAVVLQALLAGAGADATIAYPRGRVKLEDAVGTDEGEMWGWSIFPEGFNPVDLLDLTRLQTWTMKPAALK
ncbi:MAG: hypothetical protein ACYC5O_04805 [Anaerolineae bacterium]